MRLSERHRRGATLLELLLTLSMLGLILSVAFQFFRWGTFQFQSAGLKGDLQAEGLRISRRLASDLEKSASETLSLETGTGREVSIESTLLPRHALCFGSLSDWSSPSNFQSGTGLPLWDRYLIYYANLSEVGSLYRLLIDPGGPALGPFPDFPGSLLSSEPPTGNPAVLGAGTLTSSLRTFKVEPRPTGHLHCTVALWKKTSARSESGRRGEQRTEVVVSVKPQNRLP